MSFYEALYAAQPDDEVNMLKRQWQDGGGLHFNAAMGAEFIPGARNLTLALALALTLTLALALPVTRTLTLTLRPNPNPNQARATRSTTRSPRPTTPPT